MYKHILYTILIAIFIIGCSEPVEEVDEDIPPPPPPPTPQEVAAKLSNDLKLDAPLPAEGATFDPAELARMTNLLKQQNAQLSATEDGKISMQIVSQKIDSQVRKCYSNERWAHVLAFSDMHLILQPESTKFIAERTLAVAELKKPQVTIKGIIKDGSSGSRLAYLEIYLPFEGKTYSESMKLGDQLYGIRFTEIIGNNQGIIFEYLETGESFEVLTKAASK